MVPRALVPLHLDPLDLAPRALVPLDLELLGLVPRDWRYVTSRFLAELPPLRVAARRAMRSAALAAKPRRCRATLLF